MATSGTVNFRLNVEQIIRRRMSVAGSTTRPEQAIRLFLRVAA